ncbi:MAG: efflux RND transporter permease subunit, partial [Deltaproteobacteria bacterium]|nr:efflux RND transporter permease subunit [Deltaproteobacteria bacterium]
MNPTPGSNPFQKSIGPISWMAGHSIAANLLMLVLLVGGFILSIQVKKEVFPDFDLDFVTVTVPYPGASPEEVERGIILAIEEAVQGVHGVHKVTATASEGAARVTIEMIEGEDIQRFAQDIQNEMDRITSFPSETERPAIGIAQRKRYVVSLALYGAYSQTILREAAEEIRDRLLQDADITQVDLSGVRDLEISIEIPQDRLRAYNLTIDQVAQTIRRAAVELPGGAIKSEAGDVLIRMKERRDFGREFENIPVITTKDGTGVLLGDIAQIKDGFQETDEFASYNGSPAIMIEVYRVGDQTPIAVSNTVKTIVAAVRPTLPPGLFLELRNDRSDIYRQRMDLMLRNGYIGLALVFILLALFLEPRLAFWVSLGIPISILGAFFLLPIMGVSINIISMFAFIITLGIVVDDAIVAGENMYHHRQLGIPWIQAAILGTREIAMPVIFSILTNIVAFMPMFFVPGFMGKIFRQIPVVVISVFIISLVESLLILPAHIGHRREGPPAGPFGWLYRRQQQFGNFFSHLIRSRYGPLLKLALRNRYVTISLGIFILIVTVGYVKSGRMGFELFPKVESDYAKVTATLPYGTATRKTQAVQEKLVRAAQEVAAENGGDQLVEGIFAEISGNQTSVQIYLTPPDIRPVSTAALTRAWRERTGQLPGLESIKFESDAGGPGRGAVISVELSHRNVDVLAEASAGVAEALGFFPNVADIDDGFSPGKQQIDFKVRPEAKRLGLDAQAIARQLRFAYYGTEALRQQRGRNKVKVMVRRPRSERVSEQNLEEMILQAPSGGEIPLMEAVSLSRGRAYTTINRRDGRRVVSVTADVRPRSQADRILEALTAETLPKLKARFPGLNYSFEGRQADRRESMASLLRGLLMAL